MLPRGADSNGLVAIKLKRKLPYRGHVYFEAVWPELPVAKDKAYRFMNSIKGTPAYWKKFLHEVLAMIKELGLPTFFMTL